MAKPTNTLIGKTYGSVGGATFSSWKGINVLKEKPIPANPQTQAQMEQRLKMALFVATYQSMAPGFKVGFSEMAIKKSAFNAFISEAFSSEAWQGSYPSYALDPAKLNASKGSLYPTEIVTLSADISLNQVEITFGTNLSGNQSSLDVPVIIAYNDDKGTWDGATLGTRADGSIVCQVPPTSVAGDTIYAWLFFIQPSSGKVSDSALDNVAAVA